MNEIAPPSFYLDDTLRDIWISGFYYALAHLDPPVTDTPDLEEADIKDTISSTETLESIWLEGYYYALGLYDSNQPQQLDLFPQSEN